MSKLEDTAYNYGAEVGTRKPRRIAELKAEIDRLREEIAVTKLELETVANWKDRAEKAIAEIDRLRVALKECAAPWLSRTTTISGAAIHLSNEFQRRMNLANDALAKEGQSPADKWEEEIQ